MIFMRTVFYVHKLYNLTARVVMSKFHFDIIHTHYWLLMYTPRILQSAQTQGAEICKEQFKKSSCEENIELHAC